MLVCGSRISPTKPAFQWKNSPSSRFTSRAVPIQFAVRLSPQTSQNCLGILHTWKFSSTVNLARSKRHGRLPICSMNLRSKIVIVRWSATAMSCRASSIQNADYRPVIRSKSSRLWAEAESGLCSLECDDSSSLSFSTNLVGIPFASMCRNSTRELVCFCISLPGRFSIPNFMKMKAATSRRTPRNERP